MALLLRDTAESLRLDEEHEEEIESLDEDDLAFWAESLKDGVEVKDRRYHLRVYTSCFLGTEACDWFVKYSPLLCPTRQKAEELGQRLQQQGLLQHVTFSHSFHDKPFFYRFKEDEKKNRCLNELTVQQSTPDLGPNEVIFTLINKV
jgi:hypothetical protein